MKKFISVFLILFSLVPVYLNSLINVDAVTYYDKSYYNGIYAYYLKDDGTVEISFNESNSTQDSVVNIPSKIDGYTVSSFRGCFFHYDNVETINFPKTIKEVSGVFPYSGEGLKNINVVEDNPYFKSVNGILFSKDMTKLIAYPAGRDDVDYSVPEGIKVLERDSLMGCYFNSLILPESLEHISCRSVTYPKNGKLTIPINVKVIEDWAIFAHTAATVEITILNPSVDMGKYALATAQGGIKHLTVCGYPGSTAEQYVEKYASNNYNCEFIPLKDKNEDSENLEFNQNIYIAKKWTEKDSHFQKSIKFHMDLNNDPTIEITNKLHADKGFQVVEKGWLAANIVNDPSKALDHFVSLKQYYESILFSLLNVEFENKSISDYIGSSMVTSTVNLSKSFAKLVNKINGLDYNKLLAKGKLSNTEKSLIKNEMKSWKSSKYSEFAGVLGGFIDYANNIDEFIETSGKYFLLLDIDNSIKTYFVEMYNQCDTNNLMLKEAIKEVKNACNDKIGVLIAGVENGAIQIAQWSASYLLDKIWEKICTAIPVVACLKAGLAVGISIDNFMFSTDKTIAQYYASRCLQDTRELINTTSLKLGDIFSNSKTEENAIAYISSVNMIYNSEKLSYEYIKGYFKTIYDSRYCKIIHKDQNSYKNSIKQAEVISEYISEDHESLQKSWAFNLLDDYPELFEKISKEIGLFVYANVNKANIHTEYLVAEYDGKEKKPSLTISLNGIELIEDKDYVIKSYNNNVNPGKAEVVIEGKGNYEGSAKKTFFITPKLYRKRIDIRNNGKYESLVQNRNQEINLVGTDITNSSFTESKNDGFKIVVSKNNITVAEITNGEIVKEDIHVLVDQNMVSLFLTDDDYNISVCSSNETNIDYSIKNYDEKYNTNRELNYNGIEITSGSVIEQQVTKGPLNDNDLTMDKKRILPDYDSMNTDGKEKYTIDLVDSVSSCDNNAYAGEYIIVTPIVPYGYSFIKWQSNDIEIDNIKCTTISFVMPDHNVKIKAILKAPSTPVVSTKKTLIFVNKSKVYLKGTAKITVKNAKGQITYKSSNTKVAKVSSKGIITGVKRGTATITVRNNGIIKKIKITVKRPKLSVVKKTIKKGKSFTIKITGKIGKVRFKSNNKKIVTVDKKGKVIAQKNGKTTIQVKTNGIKLKCKITVK